MNSIFNSPAVFDPDSGTCLFNCVATAAQLGLQIGIQTLLLDRRDLVYQTVTQAVVMHYAFPRT